MTETIFVPEIKVGGVKLETLDPDAALAELRVSRSSGSAASAQLWIDMTDSDVDSIQVGSTLEINVMSLDGPQAGGPIFEGSVTSIGIEVEARRTQLIVGAHDASSALGRATVSTSRLNMSARDIISSIASDFGLTADIEGDLGMEPFPHFQETGTAFQAVTDIARTYGCEWFVKGTKLVVKRRAKSPPIKLSGDTDLRRFSARFSAIDQMKSVTVRQWDSVQQKVAESTLVQSGPSDVPITGRGRDKSKAAQKPGVGVAMPGLGTATLQPKTLAAGIDERSQAAMLTGRGEVDVCSELVPGARIELKEVKTEWNGTYYVTAAEHVFGVNKPFVTRFTLGGLEPATLVDLLGQPQAGTRDRLAGGLAIGVVTDNKDPDGLNRVKVRLPILSDDNESWWTRLVSAGAGGGRGWAIVPEVNDEVVVAFAHGDINQPYVIGGLWSEKNKVPDVSGMIGDSVVHSRAFVSRKGHRLEFHDGKGDGKDFIELQLKNATTKLYLGEDGIELHSADQDIQVKTGDATIDLTKAGDIKMKAKNIEIHATTKLQLKTDSGDIMLTAGANAKMKAKMKAEVDGTAGVSLKSAAIAEIKGAMVQLN
ncbi:phage baseplate assembly protein V [Ilumatobacter sp.]|uniref:phage baseplate assembly protein V n=1 Tax=Ilumatobacter sp. TaxID=1967498 RepID=UPI00375250C4